MGYDSSFNLLVIGGEPEDRKKCIDAIQKKSGYTFEEVGEEYLYMGEAHWYDAVEDCEAVSKKFPGLTIELLVEGEDRDDTWKARIRDGQSEICRAETVFPPFTHIILPSDETDNM